MIRSARLSDAAGIARVQVESWRTTYPGIIPTEYLVNMNEGAAEARWRLMLTRRGPELETFVAVDGGRDVIGFGSCGVQRTRLKDYGGEFYALYLLDHAQGRGVGRRLMAAMAGVLLGNGLQSAIVWVLRDNPSRWFYERLGGEKIAEHVIRFAGGPLDEVGYGWRDLVPLAGQPVDPWVG